MPQNHIIAVDESATAQKAFEHAANTLPKEDKFYIIHGRHQAAAPPAFIKSAEVKEYENHHAVLDKYKRLCKETGVSASFPTSLTMSETMRIFGCSFQINL
jgi:hypothetical protein